MPLYAKRLGRGTFDIMLAGSDDYGSPGYLCDDDLRVLLECSVGVTLDTAGAAVTLMDIRALGGRNLYFVDEGIELGGERGSHTGHLPDILNYQVSVKLL